MRSAFFFVLALILSISTDAAWAGKRVALVIGVSAYKQVPQLTNPARDADAMTALFKKAGFDAVDNRRDLGISELRRAIRDFSATSQDADVAVVYYAGHGIEVDGANYLVPADAKLASDFDIEDETISLDRVMRALDGAKRLKLVILDACRDNPFANSMKRTVASRAIGRGLAKVEPSMSDTLIAFAAKAGAVASDGDGQNSPFATALVRNIAEPGLDLRIAFGRVRDEVLKATGNRQEPFVYGSLGGDTVALVPRVADPEAEARVDYELAAQVGTRETWDSFLAKHPTGFFANLARGQNSKLEAAQQGRAKADDAKRQADELAAQKATDFRRQLEEQSARQTAEAKQKLSEQAKRDLDEARAQIAEQAKKELDEARRQAEQARQQADAARVQVDAARRQAAADAQVQVEQARRDAKAQADKAQADKAQTEKLAALTPNQPPSPEPPPAAPKMDPSDIARLLQAHLKRVGCNPGNVDGKWDDGSRNALELFNKSADTRFDVKLASLDALDSVRSKTDRVCPLVCAKGQRAEGDRCVQIGCSSGYVLNASGACEKRPEPAPKPKTATRQEPAAPRSAPAPRGGGGKCFSFGGKTYCE
ncbi:caspase family protein [Bradyrhizobium xenonodulans]|uniref:Caspase family protein n=1 Tax=Bradyrhizobium xenonodulans TaxID=2736875 RepID=A0ABY7MGB2_9BRAD|nr:caspase family protein [Bradyrhizobium xenonodulans]WBL77398.1 caspase family protein [Bradyrhizobium xenonodulans]